MKAKAALAIQAAIAALGATAAGAGIMQAFSDMEGHVHVPESDWEHDQTRVDKAEEKRKRKAERNKRNFQK